MIRRAAILVGALLGACRGDDPYSGGGGGKACLLGSYRDPGPGCTVAPLAAVTIDGRADDWVDGRALDGFSASCCSNGSPGLLDIARVRDGRSLAMLMPIFGEPFAAGTAFYDVHFRRYGMLAGQLGNITVDLVIAADQSFLRVNGLRIYGIPIETALGPDGLEVRVPVDALPYAGAAYVDAWLVRSSNGAIIDPQPFSSLVCWDVAATDGPCLSPL